MSAYGAIVHVKGDWAEYSHTFGLPQWTDGLRPCYGCAGSGEELWTAHGNSVFGLRWPETTDTAYDEACTRCEHHIVLSAASKQLILDTLRYDKRPDGSRGRALSEDIPGLRLRKHDRLEPSVGLADISKLDQLEVPATITFWRVSNESVARHRNPLFRDTAVTGLSLSSLTADLLHAFYLGGPEQVLHCRALVHL